MFKRLCVLLVLGSVLLAACTINIGIPATEAAPTMQAEALPPEVAIEIQNQLSETLGVSIDQIEIASVERREWSDSGLGRP